MANNFSHSIFSMGGQNLNVLAELTYEEDKEANMAVYLDAVILVYDRFETIEMFAANFF
jgi:aconitase B